MRTILILALMCGVARAEQTIEDMQSAIRADTQLRELAQRLLSAKQAYDQAFSEYKNFRAAFGNEQKQSADTAVLTPQADKIVGIETPEFIKAMRAQADLAAEFAAKKEAKSAAGANLEAQTKRMQAEAKVRAAKGQLAAEETALANADAQIRSIEQQKYDNDHAHPNRRMDITESVTPLRARAEQARKSIPHLTQDLRRAEEELRLLTRDANVVDAQSKTASATASALSTTPSPVKPIKIFVLKDGSKVSVLSVLEDGSDFLVKGETGKIQRLAKADVVDTIFPDQ